MPPGHLIHVGFPKAGTTFLKLWFERHPQLGYARESVAGFGDVCAISREAALGHGGIRYRVTSSETFVTPFATSGRIGSADVVPDGRPLPEAQAEVCATLASMFPGAWILIVTRGFRSVILSGYSQYVRNGGANAFGVARPGKPHPEAGHSWHYSYVIDLYSRAFGDRLIILPYELLRDEPSAFLAEIENKLGLDHFEFQPRRFNESLSSAELYWYRRLARLANRAPVGDAIRRRLIALHSWAALQNRLRVPIKLLQMVRPREAVIPAEVIERMTEECRGRAERLRDHPLYARYHDEYLL